MDPPSPRVWVKTEGEKEFATRRFVLQSLLDALINIQEQALLVEEHYEFYWDQLLIDDLHTPTYGDPSALNGWQ